MKVINDNGLPHYIKIGPITYSVAEVKDLLNLERDTKANGHIDHDSNRIEVEECLEIQRKYQVVLHEILHGLWVQYSLSDASEGFIDNLSQGILALIRDNPNLIKGILNELDVGQ